MRRCEEIDRSPIFADMLALPSPQCPSNDKTLHLTDIQFEHNEIIDLFLHLVTCQPKELRFDEPGEEWTDLVSLLRFLDKYDSQRGLQLLRAYGAEGVLNQTFSVDRAFIFASLTNDLGLCIAILRQNSNHRWGKNKGTTALYRSSSVPGGALFSPRTSSLEFFGSLPLPYIWALSRTEGEVELSKDRDKFCKKFRTYVRAALEVLDLGTIARHSMAEFLLINRPRILLRSSSPVSEHYQDAH